MMLLIVLAKAAFCDSTEIPYNQRKFFTRSIAAYDNPLSHPLRTFFSRLSRSEGALLLIGDSVMQQFYSALACELEREGVWKHPSLFTNTDEAQYVKLGSSDRHGHKKGASAVEHENNSFSNSNGNHSSTTAITSDDHKVLIKFLPIYHFVDGR